MSGGTDGPASSVWRILGQNAHGVLTCGLCDTPMPKTTSAIYQPFAFGPSYGSHALRVVS